MEKYDVAAYIWPAYTGDEKRSRIFWEEGMGEWQSVKNSVSKFEGHNWPRKPLWGYVNEADPYVMEMEIEAAHNHGVNVFIYDWYWYDGLPFLENCLNDGYLCAKNNDKVKFYLMWANHYVNLTWDKRNSHIEDTCLWTGQVSRPEFERLAVRIIENYFKHPSYYRIDEKPVFMIYDLSNMIRGLGGIDATKSALDWFQNEAIKRGLPGIHLQVVKQGGDVPNLSGVDNSIQVKPTEAVLDTLGFDSITHYQFVHFTDINRDYEKLIPDVLKEWQQIENEYSIPYFPHVSIGWDNNPRFKEFRPGILTNNQPEIVEKMLREAKAYIDLHPNQKPLITINSWNEWTESSYLQPDDLYGYGYLEMIKRVFLETEK